MGEVLSPNLSGVHLRESDSETASVEGKVFAVSTLPADVQKAANEIVKAWYHGRGCDPEVQAKAVGDLSITYRTQRMTRESRGVVADDGGGAPRPLSAARMIDEYLDLMPQTVTVAPYTAPTFGDPVTYRARIVVKPVAMKRADGSEIVARAPIYTGAAALVSLQDRLSVPSDLLAAGVPSSPPILGVEIQSDERGLHHTKVLI